MRKWIPRVIAVALAAFSTLLLAQPASAVSSFDGVFDGPYTVAGRGQVDIGGSITLVFGNGLQSVSGSANVSELPGEPVSSVQVDYVHVDDVDVTGVVARNDVPVNSGTSFIAISHTNTNTHVFGAPCLGESRMRIGMQFSIRWGDGIVTRHRVSGPVGIYYVCS